MFMAGALFDFAFIVSDSENKKPCCCKETVRCLCHFDAIVCVIPVVIQKRNRNRRIKASRCHTWCLLSRKSGEYPHKLHFATDSVCVSLFSCSCRWKPCDKLSVVILPRKRMKRKMSSRVFGGGGSGKRTQGLNEGVCFLSFWRVFYYYFLFFYFLYFMYFMYFMYDFQ